MPEEIPALWIAARPAPARSGGLLGWLRRELWGGWVSSLTTLALLGCALWLLPPLAD